MGSLPEMIVSLQDMEGWQGVRGFALLPICIEEPDVPVRGSLTVLLSGEDPSLRA